MFETLTFEEALALHTALSEGIGRAYDAADAIPGSAEDVWDDAFDRRLALRHVADDIYDTNMDVYNEAEARYLERYPSESGHRNPGYVATHGEEGVV